MSTLYGNHLGNDYVARQYDPALGRFLQADTIVPDPANPQSLNRYSYTLGNPLRYTDPSGHFEHDAILDYLNQVHPETWETIWRKWLADAAWMDMLYAAGDGDIAAYMGFDGNLTFFRFTGYMKEKLTGAVQINWPTDSETHGGMALNNVQGGILGSRVSGLLQNSNAGLIVRETKPYDLGGYYIELVDFHRVNSHCEAMLNHYYRDGLLAGFGAVVGIASGIPQASKLGAIGGVVVNETADYVIPDYGTVVGDERVRLRYSLTLTNPGYARAATSGGATTMLSSWMRPNSFGN